MSWWLFNRKKANQKSFVKEYLEKAKKSIPNIRSFDQLSFVVLDTETTGLNPAEDHILSFGAVKIQGEKIQIASSVEWYLNSTKKGKEAIIIHGLMGNEKKVSLENFSIQLLEYLGNNILVGHHLGFDLEMLQKALRPVGLERFPNPCIDTAQLAIRIDHGLMVDRNRINFKEYTLDFLCQRFKIKTHDRHTAGGDAFLTASLFLKLLKLASKKGIDNWGLLNK
ncbi:3'-5' exonuclease [Algoriphagus sp.]|uniref:3'-5' exonuclease n=1 Tax=Algoriphagus sp. TaxID=1872435 RepID=UPI0025DB0EDE|nr:3'-5' exonuclease [Algoriphagus sp.]